MRIEIRVLSNGSADWISGAGTQQSLVLRAAIDSSAPVQLPPRGRHAFPTGLAVAIPSGFEGQIRPLADLASRLAIACLNSPGTVDSDYRGEVSVLLVNLGEDVVTIARGDAVAELVFAPIVQANWEVVDQLPPTPRGTGGFGSTG